MTACDRNGYVMGATVNPGNVHDSVAFDGLYEQITKNIPISENVSWTQASKLHGYARK